MQVVASSTKIDELRTLNFSFSNKCGFLMTVNLTQLPQAFELVDLSDVESL